MQRCISLMICPRFFVNLDSQCRQHATFCEMRAFFRSFRYFNLLHPVTGSQPPRAPTHPHLQPVSPHPPTAPTHPHARAHTHTPTPPPEAPHPLTPDCLLRPGPADPQGLIRAVPAGSRPSYPARPEWQGRDRCQHRDPAWLGNLRLDSGSE
jgi:hypothetical protein